MKSILRVLLCLLAVVIVTQGCQTDSELTDSEKDALVQAVKHTGQEYWTLMNQPYSNTTNDEAFKFMDENADQMWQTDPIAVIFNTGITNTQAEMKNNFKGMFDNRISTKSTLLESYYSVLANDKVLEVIRADYIITRKDSTVSDPLTMVNTSVWANINGEWKIQFSHSSFRKK